jgi:hypothetical protein
MDFHNGVSKALDDLQKANPGIPTPAICGSALQLMLNFPHKWMGDSGTAAFFVKTMTEQAQQFVELKAKADASLG